MHLINEYCIFSKHSQEWLMHNLCFFDSFFQKSPFTENYFLIAKINLATRGPLYNCLVFYEIYCILSVINSVSAIPYHVMQEIIRKHLQISPPANFGDLLTDLILIRPFLLLFPQTYITRLCIVIVNNERNILIEFMKFLNRLIRLFVVMFLCKYTVILCMRGIFRKHF